MVLRIYYRPDWQIRDSRGVYWDWELLPPMPFQLTIFGYESDKMIACLLEGLGNGTTRKRWTSRESRPFV